MIDRVAYLSLHTCPLLQPGTGNAGGMNVYIDELAGAMADRDVDVVVFTRRTDPATPQVVEVGPRYHVVHIDAGPPRHLPIANLPGVVGEFADATLGWIDESGLDFDVLHSHYWLSGWAGVLLKQKLCIPLANSFHTLGRVKDLNRRRGAAAAGAIRTLTEEEVIARSDCVVASTPHEFDDLLEHYAADPARLCTSPPGIEHDLFEPGDRATARAQTGIGAGPVVLFVGRIQQLKGVDVAIEALQRLHHGTGTELIVIGGPSGGDGAREMAHLETLAVDLGIGDRVRFLPPQPHDQLARFYRAADVLVMPSRSETFGLVAAEAQACGLPVVAAAVGGLPYIVEDGVSGLLVTDHDPDHWAGALERVLGDRALADHLAAGGVARAESFSWKATTDRLLELYDGITAAFVGADG
jgi:D-inositol-3-phosphate glycosyltransferase